MLAITLNLLTLFFLLTHSTNCLSSKHLQSRQAITRPQALRNFEVREPPTVPESEPCHLVLLQHTFGNSYGQPANVTYSPPKNCGAPDNWASVVFNLTTTSIGTQYDRLGRLYLKDIEVWRTSTAEPTKTGIVWTVMKDMSRYIPLLSTSGPLSLQLNNIVNKTLNLTGEFEVTLSAKFYPPTNLTSSSFKPSKKADKIVNLGNGIGNNFSSLITFPQNLESAFVEIFASGSAQEEFWYTNAADEYMKKIDPNNTGEVATGKGAFREVQVWIDDSLAGVVYPFPVIYTGGIMLTWWRPIAAIGAFDSPTYMIDITPFIPHLTDSQEHNVTISVEGEGDKGSINPEWILSGSIFMNLDRNSNSRTTGKIIDYVTDSKTCVIDDTKADTRKSIKSTDQPSSRNDSYINFTTKSFRKLSICSTLISGSGVSKTVQFEQDFTFTNQQSWLPLGVYQSVLMSSQGTSRSRHGELVTMMDQFNFPMNLSSTSTPVPLTNNTKIAAKLTHGYNRVGNTPFATNFGRVEITTTQKGDGELTLNSKGRGISGVGRTSQVFNYNNELLGSNYARKVEIFNVTHVIYDEESGSISPNHATEGYESLNSLVHVDSVISGTPMRSLHQLRNKGHLDL